MATAVQAPSGLPATTRPRLQAINQDFTDLNEQIRQATHIISLPDDWDTLTGSARSDVAQMIVRARADWVLRWILEKLKDDGDCGAHARASLRAWKLLDWMVEVLPVSRCAPHLRDADFLSIVEKALEEKFGANNTVQPKSAQADSHPRDDSSETVQEDPQPSRKRKRGSGASTPSKRQQVESSPTTLFDAMRTTIRSIRDKADNTGSDEERVQSEQMKMVLRTGSVQAALVLKHWLSAVQRIHSTTQYAAQDAGYLDLSLVVDIWELRAIDPKDDSGASVEQFSMECLIPALLLSQSLQQSMTDSASTSDAKTLSATSVVLDRLIVKHILIPSRTAFFNAPSDKAEDSAGAAGKAELLSSSLEPLTARLLQAAQIQDTGVEMPAYFAPLFASVPHLLDLIVRSSPARSPKARTAERPWIQASLVTLAHTVGCSLEPPEFATPRASIAAFEQCLTILASRGVNVDTKVLRDLFWFHSGFKFPLNQQKKTVNWPLIAAIVEIDPSIFLTDPKSAKSPPDAMPNDLAAFLFDQISASKFETVEPIDDDKMDVDGPDTRTTDGASENSSESFSSKDAVKKIVVPILYAFSRNRQLLAFIDRWDDQLRSTMSVQREPLMELRPRIWDDRDLMSAMAEVFERSLTLSQISTLFQKHAERLKQYTKKHSQKAHSSAMITQAILYSSTAEETIESLRPTMLSVWKTYEAWTQHDGSSQSTALETAWASLCLLLGHLWPIHLHGSAALQKEFVRPLLELASREVSSARKGNSSQSLGSSFRTAAALFVFVACDFFSTLPDCADLVEKRLQKTLKALTPGQLGTEQLSLTLEIFCTEYAQVLGSLDAETAQEVLSRLMETISSFDAGLRNPLIETLAVSIFTRGIASVEAAFVSGLLEHLEDDSNDLRTGSICALLQVSPTSLSREQREATLNKVLESLLSAPSIATSLLNIMVHLMQVPNATAKISSEGSALFDIAQALHEAEMEAAFESPPATDMLQTLVQLTLGHLIPNKDQAQNKAFFEQYGKKIDFFLKTSKTCSPAILAVFTGTLLAEQSGNALLPIDQYISYLDKALDTWSSHHQALLETYSKIPLSALAEDDILDMARSSLKRWISPKVSLESTAEVPQDAIMDETWPAIFGALAKYQLYPDTKWLIHLAAQLLRASVPHLHILQGLQDALQSQRNPEKLDLIALCGTLAKGDDAKAAYQLLQAVLSTLDDKANVGPEDKARQMALLPQLCSLLGEARDDASFNTLLDSINTILLHKPNMTSQHNIECLLTALHKLSTRSSPRLSPAHAPAIHIRLCETTRLVLLLQHNRSRLGGRFHLLLPLLQSLLLCLFIPNLNRGAALPPWLDSLSASAPTRLLPANAAHYAHLLSTLCSPTQSSVQKTRSATTLNDPIKAAREYASQYLYPLLSSLCRFTLYGRLDAEVREKLMPGIWEVVSVAQMNKESIDAMFAGLGKSERDVWRGIWSEWVRLHGRKERKGKRDD